MDLKPRTIWRFLLQWDMAVVAVLWAFLATCAWLIGITWVIFHIVMLAAVAVSNGYFGCRWRHLSERNLAGWQMANNVNRMLLYRRPWPTAQADVLIEDPDDLEPPPVKH